MPDKFESRERLAQKIDWEGGNWSALEYGITADMMPEGDTELEEAWRTLQETFAAAEAAWKVVDALLPEGWEG